MFATIFLVTKPAFQFAATLKVSPHTAIASIAIPKSATAHRFFVGVILSIMYASVQGIKRSIVVPMNLIINPMLILFQKGFTYFASSSFILSPFIPVLSPFCTCLYLMRLFFLFVACFCVVCFLPVFLPVLYSVCTRLYCQFCASRFVLTYSILVRLRFINTTPLIFC